MQYTSLISALGCIKDGPSIACSTAAAVEWDAAFKEVGTAKRKNKMNAHVTSAFAFAFQLEQHNPHSRSTTFTMRLHSPQLADCSGRAVSDVHDAGLNAAERKRETGRVMKENASASSS